MTTDQPQKETREAEAKNPVEKKKGRKEPRKGKGGRHQILLYMKPKLIKALKRLALSNDVPAYELAEEAIEAFLKTRKKERK